MISITRLITAPMRSHLKIRTKSVNVVLIGSKLILFIVFSFNLTFGQELYKVQGIVQDSLSKPIELVTVVLFDDNSNYISSFRTEADGKFYFEFLPKKSSYTLSFKSLSYKTDDLIFNIQKNRIEYSFSVTMHSDVTQLDEVIIEAEQPIKVKKDTVTFRASNYNDKTNEVLEDLLKNLPGLTVDMDGTIKVNGKPISKVLIDGDDVFDRNYKIGTKNIDANDVNEVEIIYNFNENSVLRTIIESEEIALNISIKDERSGAIYGKTNIGYGNDDNYLADLTLFKLNKNLKSFLIGKTNTIGVRAQDNLNGSMFSRSSSGALDNYRAFSDNIISTDAVTSNVLVDESYINDNRSYFSSLHLLTKPKKNLHLRGIFYFLGDDIKKRNSFNAIYTTPPIFRIRQSKFHRENSNEFNFELNLKNANGSKSYTEYNGIINNSIQNNDIRFTIDENQFEENLKIEDFYISQQLSTTFKINKMNALKLSTFFVQDKNPQTYTTTNPIIDGQDIVYQVYENPIRHFGIYSKLINKKSEWNLGIINRDEELNSKVFNENDEILQLDDFNFTNSLIYNSKDFFVFKEYHFSFEKDYDLSINAKAGYNLVTYKNNNETQNNRENNDQLYIEPELRLSKEIDNLGKFNFLYKFSYKQPQISDIYNGLLLTSNRGFSQGVNSLFNLYLHRMQLSYSKSDFRKNIFISSSISYNYNQNTFGYKYINTPDFDILIKEKADNNSVVMSSFKINKNVSSIRSGFFLEYGGVYRRSFVNISDKTEIAKNNINNFTFKYGSYFRGKLNLKSGLKFQYSKFKAANIENKNIQFSSFFQFLYEISDKIVFTFDTSQIYPNKFNGVDKMYNFIDFELKYIAIKNKLDINVKGQNLANLRSFKNSFVSLISNTETNIFFNKAFITLSASFRF